MLLQQTGKFIRSEWKRILTLALIAMVFFLFLYGFIYTLDPQATTRAYRKQGGFVLSTLKSIAEFTITYYVLIFLACLPYLRDRRPGKFLLVIFLVFAAKVAYTFLFEYGQADFNANSNSENIRNFMVHNKFAFYCFFIVLSYLFHLFICFVVAIFIDYNNRNKREDELQKQKMDAELSAIKYQINPHFLFNSLSFIYSKTVPLSEEVSNAVLLLSDIMRYALGKEEDAEGKVALFKEVTHMKNVIEINQMRFNNRLSIQYSEQIDNPNARITPLILITLVENAFKHGDLLDPANPLVVRTESDQQKIRFYISNKKKSGPKELSTGIGLNNVKQRLQLMYANKHSFTVNQNEHFYTSELIINL
ncbi:sensor histidine kinase [Chitinophaga sp. GCM10012297]|uniref:Histidine kinase n=1 Tax=Chitinophaga chungangae TaxID=2821488 RepID=A0ABS3YG68_9BACT|nr:histidine kinase [Chitinophaga chungangae]MBO9153678.1 histidine kinase [Chitinophaga chungangae]